MIDAGRQIAWQSGVSHTRSSALYVIRRMKPSITCLYLVFSAGSSGFVSFSGLVYISFAHNPQILPLIYGGKDQAILLLG
jgi:hypothetical protein